MKNLLLILSVLIMASCSSSKNGIATNGFYKEGNSYWQNQSNKIVNRNQRYARMEARSAKKEDRMTKRILQVKGISKAYKIVS